MSPDASTSDKCWQVSARYHRWHVDPGVEWLEANTDYAYLDWQLPMSQVALVLLDVWDRHYLKDTQQRAEQIIQDRLLPLVTACRQAGVRIIHAPSPPQAKKHPNWLQLDGWDKPSWPGEEAWPPQAFRRREAEFARYALPEEPRDAEREAHRARLGLHPDVRPVESEPVIATGEELHLWCKGEGVTSLVYAGFNTNACILHRDYGTLDMARRGYDILMVRDCTTGMESSQTHDELWQTRGAVMILEMFGKYSVDSQELIAGLPG
ncbi:MAG: isochorismatase family protein [Gemmatimonadetes bacterium]|nr:isochorismatase family protein [Gemmatimonadota bacterium]